MSQAPPARETLRERAERLLKGITPGDWFAADMPPNGWTVFWKPDAPICHMRWTDGMRADVEQRLEAEAKFIAAAPQLIRDLLRVSRPEATTEDRKLEVSQNEQGDYVCQHGTAMDVHCCNCHSGFLFDAEHVCPATGGTKDN